ncbi:MAG: hypothetical protein SGARI_002136 [Bacillariaceae sp.]
MLLQDDRVFVLDIRSDNNSSGNRNHHNPHVAASSNVSETAVHRRIIELFKSRDEFDAIDLTVTTSRSLSASCRSDIANCLAHMRSKKKTLRTLKADIDYMDPSVHEFVVLQCLLFEHLCIESNPLEQASLSVGLAMSIRHALTLNKNCTKILELQCGLSEASSEIMADAMTGAYDLEVLRVHLLAGRSTYLCGVLEGLQGKSKLGELHLRNVTAEVAEPLANMLNHSSCGVKELYLSYPWEGDDDDTGNCTSFQRYNTAALCASLANIRNTSVTKLILDGISFSVASSREESGAVDAIVAAAASTSSIRNSSRMAGGNTTALITAFTKLETLSIAAPEMPHLDFLHTLESEQLPQHLQHCYFPCPVPNVEEARNLVERVPSVVDIPDYCHDAVVQHFLDLHKVQKSSRLPATAAVWPFLLQRTNCILQDHPSRNANMVYKLLQDYHGMHKNGELVFSSDVAETDDNETVDDETTLNSMNMMCQQRIPSKATMWYEEEEKKEDADLFQQFNAFDEQDEAAGDY